MLRPCVRPTLMLLALLVDYASAQKPLPVRPPDTPPAKTVVKLVAGPPKDLLESAVECEVDLSRPVGSVAALWAGVTVPAQSAGDAAWDRLASDLKAAHAPFVRLNLDEWLRLPPPDAGGRPTPRREPAPVAARLTKAGASIILELTPSPGLSDDAWRTLVENRAKEYGDGAADVRHWQLAVSAGDVSRRYPAFARTLRRVQPAALVGFRTLAGDPAGAAERLTALCAVQGLPLDTFSWRAESGRGEAAASLRRIRAALGETGVRSVRLLPSLPSNLNSAEAMSFGAALLDSVRGPAPGLLAELGPGSLTLPVGTGPRLWNRLGGTRLAAHASARGLNVVAARTQAGYALLLWDAEGDRVRLARLALRGLPPSPQGAWRLVRAGLETISERPSVVEEAQDLPRTSRLELSLLLEPGRAVLLELRPSRPPSFRMAPTLDRNSLLPGEIFEVELAVRNLSTTVRGTALTLSASLPGMIPASQSRMIINSLEPQKVGAYRFRLRVPSGLREREGRLWFSMGDDSHASVVFRVESPLFISTETRRIDLDAPNSRGTVPVDLANRGHNSLDLTLSAGGMERQARLDPQAGPLRFDVEAVAPTDAAGLYPLEVQVLSGGELVRTLPVQVGVPAVCRRVTEPLPVNGDLTKWASAVPMGIGRAEQITKPGWGGPGDLSAYAFVRWDEQYLYFACAVSDDDDRPLEGGRGDCVRFAFSARPPVSRAPGEGYEPGDHEFLLERRGSKAVLERTVGGDKAVSGAKVALQRQAGRTYYEAAIPWAALVPVPPQAGMTFGFSVLVQDRDGEGKGAVTGRAEWGGGIAGAKRPGLFPPLRLFK